MTTTGRPSGTSTSLWSSSCSSIRITTPSTACSSSLLNAPMTSPRVGRVTGINVIE
jgi:hypothetical protein